MKKWIRRKTEIYKTITINRDSIDDKTVREWKKIEKAIKRYEAQFMNLQRLGDETIQDKTQNQKDL